ncbi:MAG: hypothetical protein V2I43_06465 [Parvularcula sp.]|jgi:hypothetical protein|nr:hypothetical protein [Parvularcula sp.]
MARQGVSLRRLVEEGVIKRSHRSGLFERIADGSLSVGEFNRINERLGIDPVRAALAVRCFVGPSAYEDACCATSAQVATALARQLPTEMAACEGVFEPIRESLCRGLAQRTTLAIVRYHVSLEARRDDASHFDRTFG